MHEIRSIAIDDPVARASVSLCHAATVLNLRYSFARWRRFDAVITALL